MALAVVEVATIALVALLDLGMEVLRASANKLLALLIVAVWDDEVPVTAVVVDCAI